MPPRPRPTPPTPTPPRRHRASGVTPASRHRRMWRRPLWVATCAIPGRTRVGGRRRRLGRCRRRSRRRGSCTRGEGGDAGWHAQAQRGHGSVFGVRHARAFGLGMPPDSIPPETMRRAAGRKGAKRGKGDILLLEGQRGHSTFVGSMVAALWGGGTIPASDARRSASANTVRPTDCRGSHCSGRPPALRPAVVGSQSPAIPVPGPLAHRSGNRVRPRRWTFATNADSTTPSLAPV